MNHIGKSEDIPVSTSELIAGLKSGHIASNGNLSFEILEGSQIMVRYGDSAFPIAVLMKALRDRDNEIADLKLRTGIGGLKREIEELKNRPRSANKELLDQHAADTSENARLLIEIESLKRRAKEVESEFAERFRIQNESIGDMKAAYTIARDAAQQAISQLDQFHSSPGAQPSDYCVEVLEPGKIGIYMYENDGRGNYRRYNLTEEDAVTLMLRIASAVRISL